MSTSTDTDQTDALEKQPLQLEVSVKSPQACLREVLVTIPEVEVKRYLKDAYDELVPEAQVPGFRSGRAPRQLVEKQFKERVFEQVKSSLLMDSLTQVTDTQTFSAIGEPDFDYEAIKIPDHGDFKFQFQIEVRPEFKTPDWKGIALTKPVETIGDEEIDESLTRVLSRYATLEATDEAAEMGDKLLITASFRHDGKQLSEMDEERVTLRQRLSFTDATCDDFGTHLVGVTEGETRTVKVKIASGAENEKLRGQEIDAEFHVVEVLKPELPDLTPQFLEELGDFQSEQELRDFIKDSLTRQAEYRTGQSIRQSVVGQLAQTANFDLPETLVKRQTQRELQRRVLELRRSGFDEDSIRSVVNTARQNARASTEAALREHFILEQIAEEENVDADESDYQKEIQLIAEQGDTSPRRIRARLEKQGQMDALRNQIVERKVIDLIVANAKVTEQSVKPAAADDVDEEYAVYYSVLAARDADAIPQAKYDDAPPVSGEKEKEKTKEKE
jgi:trigger factor